MKVFKRLPNNKQLIAQDRGRGPFYPAFYLTLFKFHYVMHAPSLHACSFDFGFGVQHDENPSKARFGERRTMLLAATFFTLVEKFRLQPFSVKAARVGNEKFLETENEEAIA